MNDPNSTQSATNMPYIQSDEDTSSSAEQESGQMEENAGEHVKGGSGSLMKRIGFCLVNLWLVFHLFAIIITPATPYPGSQLAQQGWRIVGPYLQFIYFNHAWHFFAPNPGGSTLLSYTLHYEDGRDETVTFPNTDIQPRLLYHRHFMMSEYMGNSPEEEHDRVLQSFAYSLCERTGAQEVSFSTIYHELSYPERLLAGGKLTDPELYSERPLGTFNKETKINGSLP